MMHFWTLCLMKVISAKVNRYVFPMVIAKTLKTISNLNFYTGAQGEEALQLIL
jgi:hypothetical protein